MTEQRRDHDHYRLLAAAGIDGELSPSELLELREHLAGCEACRLDEQAMRRDNAWLLSAQSVRPPKPALRAAVLLAAENPDHRRRSGGGSGMRLAGVLAALLLAVGAWWFGLGRTPETPGVQPSGSVRVPSAVASGTPPTPLSTPTDLACGGRPFSEPVRTSTLSAGRIPWDLAGADFNEDGIEDAVVISKDPGAVGVMLGDGRGGFSQPRPFTPADPNRLAGSEMPSIRASDLTGDSHVDVIVTNDVAGAVVIFAGDGTGGLLAPRTVEVGGRPRDVAPGRLAGGAEKDLAIADSTGRVQILVDPASGATELRAPISVTGSPVDLSVTDINGDGLDDIIIASEGDRGLVVVHQLEAGSFGPPLMLGAPPSTDVDLVDVDGDDDLDAILANAGAGSVSVLLGDGAGSFGTPDVYPFEGGAPGSTGKLDIQRDGNADIVINNGQSGDLGVLIGDGAGTFEPLVRVPAPGGATGLIVFDFDRDDREDVATSSASGDDVAVFLNVCEPAGG